MGSQIPIRQLRRSSVNARPRGATLRGLVVSAVFTNTWATSPSLCRFSVSKRSPGIRVQPWGLHPLSRDISSGFSDSLFFPSALFNSPVASGRTVSTFWKVLRYVSAGSRGSARWVRSQLTATHRTAKRPCARNRSQRKPPSPPAQGDAFQAAVVAIFARPVKRRVGSSRQQEIRATLARGGGVKVFSDRLCETARSVRVRSDERMGECTQASDRDGKFCGHDPAFQLSQGGDKTPASVVDDSSRRLFCD